jgi:hypothetical protein
MGTMCWPETSVKDYHSTLRNITEERKSHLHRIGNLKSHLEKISPLPGFDPADLQQVASRYTD